jgi:hypothetical protein
MADDNKMIEAIQQFIAITGLKDEEAALNMLQVTNFKVEEALNLYWMNNSQTEATNHYEDYYDNESANNMKRYRPEEELDEEGRRVRPDEVKKQKLIDSPMMHVNPQQAFIHGILNIFSIVISYYILSCANV